MIQFYIVSVKHTRREHKYITLWRPNDAGYCWPLSWAGKYEEADVLANLSYYNRGDDTLAVPCALLDSWSVHPEKGYIDNDAGPVVLNKKENWLNLMDMCIRKPMNKPEPQYRGARYPKARHD